MTSFNITTQQHSRPRPSGKNVLQQLVKLSTGNRVGGVLDLREACSRLSDQPQKKNGSALLQGGE